MAAAGNIRTEVHYEGQVQGVGFRFTAAAIAKHYNVTGYVQNLADGRVKLVAEGPKSDVDDLVADVARRMDGYIHHQDRRDSPPQGGYAVFGIRH